MAPSEHREDFLLLPDVDGGPEHGRTLGLSLAGLLSCYSHIGSGDITLSLNLNLFGNILKILSPTCFHEPSCHYHTC